MFSEKCFCLRMCRRAGHYQKRDRRGIPSPKGEDFLGMDLKEALVRYWANREHSLGVIKAEAAPLATGHQQDRNLPATQGVFAESAGLWAFVPERNDRRRRDLLRPRQHKRLVPLRIQLTQLFQIDRPQLFEQAAALVVVQAVPRGDHVFLAVLAELVSQVR